MHIYKAKFSPLRTVFSRYTNIAEKNNVLACTYSRHTQLFYLQLNATVFHTIHYNLEHTKGINSYRTTHTFNSKEMAEIRVAL